MRTLVLLIVLALAAGACTGGGAASPPETAAAVSAAAVAAAAVSTTQTTSPASTVPASNTVTTLPVTSTTVAVFSAEILPVDEEIAARMPYSWHEGCPVGLGDLRLLRIPYYDMSGTVRTGELVVNADVAEGVVIVFEALFDAQFPIERMELVDVYGGDDLASMQADNTSAFNCRFVEGTNHWSEHAFGRAIDINPLINPWVRGATVSPAEGAPYVDRSLDVPGMIHDGDVVVTAFAGIGWVWGGTWRSSKDYQHFSQSGR